MFCGGTKKTTQNFEWFLEKHFSLLLNGISTLNAVVQLAQTMLKKKYQCREYELL